MVAVELDALKYVFDLIFDVPTAGLVELMLQFVELFTDTFVFRTLTDFVKQVMILSNGLRGLAKALGDDFEDGAIEDMRDFLVELANSEAWYGFDLARIGLDFSVQYT